jgi:hypothetical protein
LGRRPANFAKRAGIPDSLPVGQNISFFA